MYAQASTLIEALNPRSRPAIAVCATHYL